MARPADRHLTQDELEALVSISSLKTEEFVFSADDSEDLASHIAQCEKCRALAESYTAAEARLVSLRSGHSLARKDDCPADEEWLSVAAGLLPAERIDRDMNHAANCDHCGSLLREAVEDLTDELNPEEEHLIAHLTSSTPEWQRRFARRLCGAEVPKASTTLGNRWRSFLDVIRRFSVPALAAALILLILGGLRAGQWKKRSDVQIAQATANAERLLRENTEQRLRISELSAQLERSNTQVASTGQHAEGFSASLVLEPKLTRGAGEVNRLRLPPRAEFVSVTLRFSQIPSEVLREELFTSDRQLVWSQESRGSADELKNGKLLLLVPAHVLDIGDYQLIVSRQSAGQFEELATYTFRVAR